MPKTLPPAPLVQPHITGIQQVGIGVPHALKARLQYQQLHHMVLQLFDSTDHASLMTRYTGNTTWLRRAMLTMNLGGGGGFEIWQFLNRPTQMAAAQIAWGQPGINAVFLRCYQPAFIQKTHAHYHIPLLALTDPQGEPILQGEDMFDNRFRFVPSAYQFGMGEMASGGVCGAMIGVRNTEKSMRFYQQFLGFEQMIYQREGSFADLPGAAPTQRFKRTMLYKPGNEEGAFTRLLGDSYIELIELLNAPAPEHFFAGRYWGDGGFIHLCFDVIDMDALKLHATAENVAFTVDSGAEFRMEKSGGRFAYCEDPDGTLIELVETHRIPLVKKLGWYLKLGAKKRRKPLPNWMLGLLAMHKIKG